MDFKGEYEPGTIVVKTAERRLYLVLEDGKAMRYGVGVGRKGFTWTGTHSITLKREWPGLGPICHCRRHSARRSRSGSPRAGVELRSSRANRKPGNSGCP